MDSERKGALLKDGEVLKAATFGIEHSACGVAPELSGPDDRRRMIVRCPKCAGLPGGEISIELDRYSQEQSAQWMEFALEKQGVVFTDDERRLMMTTPEGREMLLAATLGARPYRPTPPKD